jgi:LDH2 family malate/lactate/ureidoglycolate dehydrogenase
MPIYSPDQIEKLSAGIFKAVGAPVDIAEHVARSLVESNLLGHDSHGVLRIPSYLESIEKGTTVPAARPSVLQETETTASVDGNQAFGQISAHFATTVGIEKARAHNVAAVSVTRCNHIGRLGEYTELAARHGMFAFMAGGTYNSGAVAPFGGASRVLGTNPISFALPGGNNEPVVADIATSVAAEGKLRVARAKGQPVAPGTILDKDGNPSTNPNDYYAGGVLLTFGGHKGYVLSVIGDLIARYVSGGELTAPDGISFSNFLVVINLEAFRPLADFEKAVTARLGEIKAAKPAPGFDEVLLPGEPERRTRAKRAEEGIALPDDTVNQLSQIATKYGLSMPEQKA